MLIGLLIALVAGIFIATQGSINGLVGNTVGVLPTVVIPVFFQFALYSILLVSSKKTWVGVTQITSYAAGWSLLGLSALLGIGIMVTLTVAIMRVGPLMGLAVVVFGQLFSSMVIEHFGWFETTQRTMSLDRVIGLVLIIGGVWFFSKK